MASAAGGNEGCFGARGPTDSESFAYIAIAWSATARQGKPEAFTAYIEMGRSATLYRMSQGEPLFMGEMFLGAARKFVKDLREVPVT